MDNGTSTWSTLYISLLTSSYLAKSILSERLKAIPDPQAASQQRRLLQGVERRGQ